MTTYDVLVSDELLALIGTADYVAPEGWRIVGPAEGPAGYRMKRMRVEDDNAPAWTEGKLVDPVFTSHYDDDGQIDHVTVTGWTEVNEETLRIGAAMAQAEDNPGRRFTV